MTFASAEPENSGIVANKGDALAWVSRATAEVACLNSRDSLVLVLKRFGALCELLPKKIQGQRSKYIDARSCNLHRLYSSSTHSKTHLILLAVWSPRPKTLQIFVSSGPAGDTALLEFRNFCSAAHRWWVFFLSIGARRNRPSACRPICAGRSQNFDCRPLGSIVKSAGSLSFAQQVPNSQPTKWPLFSLGVLVLLLQPFLCVHDFSSIAFQQLPNQVYRAELDLSHGDVRAVASGQWERPSTREVLRPR